MVQEVPVSDEKLDQLVTMTTFFPDGGTKPARVSATLPKKLSAGRWPAVVYLYDGQIHLIQRPVGPHVLPIAETMSGVGTAFGFTVGLEQRIDYKTAQLCKE